MVLETAFAQARTSYCVARLMCSAGSHPQLQTILAGLVVYDEADGQLPLIDQSSNMLLSEILAINPRKS